ncbi:hypothetical protein C7H19_18080 [Aphanothece hegewaldii CCALA 016]|uniref:HlyD family secretion protein n=1 Tax=Aphanothece hegewaldii CCALA 016 TaxID=2107694 RepID=A0A2T1LUC2_9CHRO|nr:hypothetical protein [Aphanothece hegewaldii]PSF35049.1 hypothetical protein C7H19_18080 [Aphanothece hegewaldii CCALA 016]
MSIYNLIGWLALLGIVIGASTAFRPQTSPPQKQPLLPSPVYSPSTSYYHKITATLTSLEDLKIKVGDRIQPDTIITEHPTERQELATKQQQLEAKITQLSLPIPPISPLFPPNLASEEIALRQAKLKLEQITQKMNTGSSLKFKQPELSAIFESDKIEQLNQLQDQQHNARLEIEAAIARLDEAKSRYEQQLDEYKLRLAEYQTRLQRQQDELILLQNQLKTLRDQQHNTGIVRSPYSGKVHRIKVIKQQDQNITVEIILVVRDDSNYD